MKSEKFKNHHDRPDLVGEHRYGDAGQLFLFLIFIAIWILDSFVFHWTTFLQAYVPLISRIIISAVIFISSGWIAWAGLKVIFGEKEDKPKLVDKGVFSRVRHPVYLGALVLYPGFFVLTCSLLSAGFWIIIIFFYHYIAKYEEGLMIKEFGDEYRRYQNRTAMWIPRVC